MPSKKYRAISPAKINWQLNVEPLRSDNDRFHKVDTILQTLSLHDNLEIAFDVEEENSTIKSSGAFSEEMQGTETSDNLVAKAIYAIYELKGISPKPFQVTLEKNIPLKAGLGGGSSNAAAAILAACEHLRINSLAPETLNVAENLGSDVPFFLHGGCSHMTGKGDKLANKLSTFKTPLLLVKPDIGISTRECYEKFDELHNIKKQTPDRDVMNSCNTYIDEESGLPILQNSLQPSACELSNEIAEVIEFLKSSAGQNRVLLSGSGACVFAICDTFDLASKLAGVCALKGWWARATSTSSVGACLLK